MNRLIFCLLVAVFCRSGFSKAPELLSADVLSLETAKILAAYGEDEPTALAEKLRPAAEAGDRDVLYALARLYAEEDDEKTALDYLRRAAAKEHAVAQYQLAMAYLTGEGAPQNDVQAVAWLQKAAAQQSEAAYNLGVLYQTGHFGVADSNLALRWYQQAADAGFAPAQYRLGAMLAQESGLVYDPNRARSYLALAAAQGHSEAENLLQEIDGKSDKNRKTSR